MDAAGAVCGVFIVLSLVVTTQVLIPLKVEGKVDISYSSAAIPGLIVLGMVCCAACTGALIALKESREQSFMGLYTRRGHVRAPISHMSLSTALIDV